MTPGAAAEPGKNFFFFFKRQHHDVLDRLPSPTYLQFSSSRSLAKRVGDSQALP